MRRLLMLCLTLAAACVSMPAPAIAQRSFGPPILHAEDRPRNSQLRDAVVDRRLRQISVLDLKIDSLEALVDSAKAGHVPQTSKMLALRSDIARLYFLRDSLHARRVQLELDTAGASAALSNVSGLEVNQIRYSTLNDERSRPLLAARTGYIVFTSAGGYVGGLIDRDHGGYRDDLVPRVDKLAHGFGSVILARLIADRAGPLWGLASCAAAGAALEQGQSRNHGYASWHYDFVYDVGGCATGVLWSLRDRHR